TNGDGCSDKCVVEPGWQCSASGVAATVIDVPVVFRDVIAIARGSGTRHPDFQVFSGSGATKGLVTSTLGDTGKPVYAGICDNDGPSSSTLCPNNQQLTTQANFDQWYRDTAGVNIP